MEVVQDPLDECREAHEGRVANAPVVRLKLFHGEDHRFGNVRLHILPQISVLEDELHDVESMNFGILAILSCIFDLVKQEI
jgi:hypothetical protein